jgi:hypothetical protein
MEWLGAKDKAVMDRWTGLQNAEIRARLTSPTEQGKPWKDFAVFIHCVAFG